jgi:membrane associated rhomboid family serine protease
MDSVPIRIEARSRRQAMEWSLVLASQGLEPVIEQAIDGSGWGLIINEADYSRAQEAIRLYELENRHWPWQQPVFQPGLLFDWASLGWALLVVVFYWLAEVRIDLTGAGAMDRTAVSHGQWWRLFTALWLHADIAHLAGNTGMGIILLGLTMGRFGSAIGLFASLLAGAGGNLAAWLLASGPHQSLGASGVIMGALGLLAVQSVPLWRLNPAARKFIVSGFLGGVFLFLFLGTSPGTDVLAHAGGFLSGIILGSALTMVPRRSPQRLLNLFSALGFGLLVLWPWWLAIRNG